MPKNTEKRKIPERIKRQLRQEANFGCCKCGNPIIEYHHIKMWSKVETHHHEDMMVLCPTCHHSIESYPEIYQQKLKANPYNKDNTNPSGKIIIAQSFCAIDTGSIFLIGDGPVVRSKNVNYIEVYCNEDDMLEISLQLFNENNENVIKVVRNEWVTGNAQLWDLEFISASKVLKIKEKKGLTNLEINVKNIPVTIKGELWIDGKPLKLASNGITYNNISLLTTNETSEKFGIWHFNQDAYSFRFAKNIDGKIGPCIETRTYESNTICFNGDTYYSGCVIDLSEDGALRLTPKQTPYEIQTNVALKKDHAERLLINSIKSIEFFQKNITEVSDFNKMNPYMIGMEVHEKSIASFNFWLKLARYYARVNEQEKAILTFQKTINLFDSDDVRTSLKLANINFEFSKYLIHIGKKSLSKNYFKSAVDLFYKNSFDLPYRVHDFGKKIASGSECFCGSNKKYSECHYDLTKIKNYKTKTRKIEFKNIKEESRISLFILKEHSNKWDITIEDYVNFYEMLSSEVKSGTHTVNFKSDRDIAMLLRIDSYGLMPKITEFILRENDIYIF